MAKHFFFFICILVACSSFAQTTDQKAVSASVEKLRKAMIDADSTILDKLTSDGLSYGHSSGKMENKQEFISSLTSGRSDFVSIDLSEQSIAVSGHTAVVRHVLLAETNDSGHPGGVKLKVILVWTKEKGKWKLFARQAVKFP
ncbi:MAG: hypothetical protein JWO03_751 [Bacteroidetes bacterium]|nr:hypothetical protein [Bacteroidota bacterium]